MLLPHHDFTVLLTKNPKVLIEFSISTLGFTKVKTAILPVYTPHIYKQTDFHSQKSLRMEFVHILTCGLTIDQSHQAVHHCMAAPLENDVEMKWNKKEITVLMAMKYGI